MAWSIYYRIVYPRPWTEPDKAKLRAHADRWMDRMSSLSSGLDLRGLPEKKEFRGATRAAPSPRAANDYVAIVSALRELEELFPGLEAYVSDDSELNRDVRPKQIDLEALRRAILEEWDDPKGEYADSEESDDPEEELERVSQRLVAGDPGEAGVEADDGPSQITDSVRAATQALLEKAAKDFEIWKSAQRAKSGKS